MPRTNPTSRPPRLPKPTLPQRTPFGSVSPLTSPSFISASCSAFSMLRTYLLTHIITARSSTRPTVLAILPSRHLTTPLPNSTLSARRATRTRPSSCSSFGTTSPFGLRTFQTLLVSIFFPRLGFGCPTDTMHFLQIKRRLRRPRPRHRQQLLRLRPRLPLLPLEQGNLFEDWVHCVALQ
jgi:hypothetical protein